MIHIPILRHGVPYKSLDVIRIPHHRTRETFAEMSQANPGIIRRDLREEQQLDARQTLARVPAARLLDICRRAADHFLNDTLPLGEAAQTPDDYVQQLSATTGMPHVLVRRNMAKIAGVMTEMATVLRGLTRGLDLSLLDAGYGEHAGHAVSFYPRTNALGVVLPSNSPGVHSLWVPAIALKMPLVLKPGSAEPWSPFRIAQAFMKAGCPPEAFCYYPADHAGAGEILRRTGRSMFFGDVSAVGAWEGDPRVEIHGPGYSKVLFGDDQLEHWDRHIDLIARSVADNGGRSCVNASGVWVRDTYAEQVARALAKKLVEIVPRPATDEQATLAPFADPRVAERLSQQIDAGLATPGAREITAELRDGPRLVQFDGSTYLLPTVVLCESADHPLANREFLFPYVSVVKVGAEEMERMPAPLGRTLVVTALTENRRLVDRLLSSPNVDRLNVGPIATNVISWDQPHEGNLFEHLYARRSFQAAVAL
ncbi:MAG TPA: aldehyde dehydrogenase family protein [Vicinamibacterales bacterium]|nr:aldehyde dehydrogenase family protein [Vicinamibacterales bacterium]